jgi:hypothetical protein
LSGRCTRTALTRTDASVTVARHTPNKTHPRATVVPLCCAAAVTQGQGRWLAATRRATFRRFPGTSRIVCDMCSFLTHIAYHWRRALHSPGPPRGQSCRIVRQPWPRRDTPASEAGVNPGVTTPTVVPLCGEALLCGGGAVSIGAVHGLELLELSQRLQCVRQTPWNIH